MPRKSHDPLDANSNGHHLLLKHAVGVATVITLGKRGSLGTPDTAGKVNSNKQYIAGKVLRHMLQPSRSLITHKFQYTIHIRINDEITHNLKLQSALTKLFTQIGDLGLSRGRRWGVAGNRRGCRKAGRGQSERAIFQTDPVFF